MRTRHAANEPPIGDLSDTPTRRTRSSLAQCECARNRIGGFEKSGRWNGGTRRIERRASDERETRRLQVGWRRSPTLLRYTEFPPQSRELSNNCLRREAWFPRRIAAVRSEYEARALKFPRPPGTRPRRPRKLCSCRISFWPNRRSSAPVPPAAPDSMPPEASRMQAPGVSVRPLELHRHRACWQRRRYSCRQSRGFQGPSLLRWSCRKILRERGAPAPAPCSSILREARSDP